MKPRVEIDLNVRSGVDQTYAGFEDVTGDLPSVGDIVDVFESESGLVGIGQVLELRHEARIVVLGVRFSDLTHPLPSGARLVFGPVPTIANPQRLHAPLTSSWSGAASEPLSTAIPA